MKVSSTLWTDGLSDLLKIIIIIKKKWSCLAAVAFCLSLPVIEWLVPFLLCLPGIFQNGAEDSLKKQDNQIDDEKRVHRPERELHKWSNGELKWRQGKLFPFWVYRWWDREERRGGGCSYFSTAERFWDLHL